jgi:hypothetical protein
VFNLLSLNNLLLLDLSNCVISVLLRFLFGNRLCLVNLSSSALILTRFPLTFRFAFFLRFFSNNFSLSDDVDLGLFLDRVTHLSFLDISSNFEDLSSFSLSLFSGSSFFSFHFLFVGNSLSVFSFTSDTSLVAFDGTCDGSLAALLALCLHLAVLSLASTTFSLLLTQLLLIFAGGGSVPFKLFEALIFGFGLILGQVFLNFFSVELQIDTHTNDFVFVKNADVLAAVLLGLSNQGHLLFGKFNNLFIAGAILFAHLASLLPLRVEFASAAATELSTSASTSVRSITIMVGFASVGAVTVDDGVAFGVDLRICAVASASTELTIATDLAITATTPLATASEFTATSLGEVFTVFFILEGFKLGGILIFSFSRSRGCRFCRFHLY